MDRELSSEELRGARRRRISLVLAAAAILGSAYWVLGAWLRPSASRQDLRLGRVEAGSIDQTLQAVGTVVPLEERLVTSPADARLLRVMHRAGDRVEAGEPILLLDVSGLELERSKRAQQLALEQNALHRAELSGGHRVGDLEAEIRKQRLSLDFLGAKREQAERLHRDGLASREALLAATLEQELAQATLESSEARLANAHASVEAELAAIGLEIGMLERELHEIDGKLARSRAVSDVAGTLTFTLTEPGATVQSGEVLARISDLTAFRVRATISDTHAARLEVGLLARVRVDGQALDGRVGTVLPAVENGTVTFLVELDVPGHPGLRASRRVDVEVVVDRHENTLIVRRGPAIAGTGPQRLFVVHGDRAERRDVTVGMVNLDWCELVSGVAAGDELILSDTGLWRSVDVLALR